MLLPFTLFANHKINCSFHVHLLFRERIKCAVIERYSFFWKTLKSKQEYNFSLFFRTTSLRQAGFLLCYFNMLFAEEAGLEVTL
jgi:hypothetical protein